MGPLNGRNLERVKCFSIKEYLQKIEFESNTLNHVEYVNRAFDKYIEELMKYDDLAITLFLIRSFSKEIKFSNIIENHIVHPLEINEHNMFFDKLSVNHTRIKELHQFVLKKDEPSEYRTCEMPIGTYRKISEQNEQDILHNFPNAKIITKDGDRYLEDIYWYGAEADDIKHFMDDFISFYKDTSLSLINSNPFIKSALIHLIFLRIHPFEDGNGRTARMLHNIKFTDSINRIKGSRLKISPLNISPVISKYKNDYNSCIDNIYFDLDHVNNPAINRWLNFMLFNVEEEIAFLEQCLIENHQALQNISEMRDDKESLFEAEIKKMRLEALQPKKY